MDYATAAFCSKFPILPNLHRLSAGHSRISSALQPSRVAFVGVEMPWSKVLVFNDPAQYATSVRSAEIQIFPTTKGDFRAELTQVTLNELWMQRFAECLPRVHRGTISPGRQVYTFLTNEQPEVHSRGRLLSLGEMCVHDYDVQHVKTSGDYRFGGVSLRPEALATTWRALVGSEFNPHKGARFIRPNSGLMSRFLNLHAIAGGLAKSAPDLFTQPEVAHAIEQHLLHALINCLADCEASNIGTGLLRHGIILGRFEEYLEANPNTPLHLSEVCAAIGVAERTLRAACEEHLGMGPIRYLTLRRMHLVRHALRQAAPDAKTVTQVATAHGFCELGRFAVAYRQMFDESPIATLRKTPDSWQEKVSRPLKLVS
ncbi:helix-turn-helix domain-containing protein [Bradyrhizobium sp. RT6a]|jgi:AraC-like DNA-binding protein|uniref:helix-turn-helix domain-containing protein n=2 Tax=Bradyrhizobium TaxID=374 RepID=UPI003391BA50